MNGDIAWQLLVNASEIEHQHTVNEDEQIIAAKEAEGGADYTVVHEVVAGLSGKVRIVLDPRNRRDPAAIRQDSSGRTIRLGHAGWKEILVAGAGGPEGSAIAMVPVGP